MWFDNVKLSLVIIFALLLIMSAGCAVTHTATNLAELCQKVDGKHEACQRNWLATPNGDFQVWYNAPISLELTRNITTQRYRHVWGRVPIYKGR